jgi:nucleoside-diphosphate-sugar epimerase
MTNRFTILGVGWLGLSLASKLKEKYELKLSCSNDEKKQNLSNLGFENIYLFNEKNLDNLDELLDTDYLFINYPPSKFEDYLAFLSKIYTNNKIKKIKKIIFISSTSIYPNEDALMDESLNIVNPVSSKVFNAENIVKANTDVIFRASGLMGYDRIAGKYFSAKQIDTTYKKVNHVHKDDVIYAIIFALETNLEGIFNLCASEHPTCKELYLSNSKKYGFKAPIFKNEKEYKHRIINGSKIESFGFKYKYSNPLEF